MTVFAHRALLDSLEIQALLEKLVSMCVLLLFYHYFIISFLLGSNMIYYLF